MIGLALYLVRVHKMPAWYKSLHLVYPHRAGHYHAMDTLTHALSGMLLARATAPGKTDTPQLPLYVRMWCGFLAAAFPDADFVMRYFGSLSYLEHHRGVTHSFLMLPLWALLLSVVFMLIWRRRYHWKMFLGVSAMSVLIHILGDVITAYGTAHRLAPGYADNVYY